MDSDEDTPVRSYGFYETPRASSSGPHPAVTMDVVENDIVGEEGFVDNSVGRKTIDLVFIQDATGSMGSYIASATENIRSICDMIIASENLASREDLRVALVSYRDHKPQDKTYVTQVNPFTSDIEKVHEQLTKLYASGGGDGPEASTRALRDACDRLVWRSESAKLCILITDAPPHGIGESGDGIADGDPAGFDPVQIARRMATRGICLFVVACEPNLSNYKNGVHFYQALCNITSGLMLPLTTASLLANAIVGSVLENLDMERLVREVGQQVAARVGENQDLNNIDAVAKELHDALTLRGENTKKVQVESIYRDSEEAAHNVRVWTECESIKEGKLHVKRIKESPFSDAYLASKLNTSRRFVAPPRRARTPEPALPPAALLDEEEELKSTRRSSSTSRPGVRTRSMAIHDMGDDSDDDGIGSSRSPSPVVSPVMEFKPFAVAPKMKLSVGSPGKSDSKFGGSAFTMGPRGGKARGMDDDDDDDDEEDAANQVDADASGDGPQQRIGLFQDPISLEQAKRIAHQSIWRMRG